MNNNINNNNFLHNIVRNLESINILNDTASWDCLIVSSGVLSISNLLAHAPWINTWSEAMFPKSFFFNLIFKTNKLI